MSTSGRPSGRRGLQACRHPKRMGAFWAFWCDEVQPAVRDGSRRHLGHRLVHGGRRTPDSSSCPVHRCLRSGLGDPDGRLVIGDPRSSAGLSRPWAAIRHLPQGLPPDSVSWVNIDNNKAFLAQTVIMTQTHARSRTRSSATARRLREHRNDRVATRSSGEPFPIEGFVYQLWPSRVVPRRTANEFVRFLVADGWLMHYLNFSADRICPRSRRCSISRSGSTRATRTTWPR